MRGVRCPPSGSAVQTVWSGPMYATRPSGPMAGDRPASGKSCRGAPPSTAVAQTSPSSSKTTVSPSGVSDGERTSWAAPPNAVIRTAASTPRAVSASARRYTSLPGPTKTTVRPSRPHDGSAPVRSLWGVPPEDGTTKSPHPRGSTGSVAEPHARFVQKATRSPSTCQVGPCPTTPTGRSASGPAVSSLSGSVNRAPRHSTTSARPSAEKSASASGAAKTLCRALPSADDTHRPHRSGSRSYEPLTVSRSTTPWS